MEHAYSNAAAYRYALILSLMRRYTPPPGRIVELGAAPGEQSAGLSHAGYDVTAVDIGIGSDAWDDAEEGTMEANFRSNGVEFVQWDLEEAPYPLPDSRFDAVVMTEVFEHLRDYPIRSLKETARVLKRGGHLYFTTPNAAYLGSRVKLARGRTVHTELADWIGGVPHARHAREYTFQEVETVLNHVGLETVLLTSRHLHVNSGRRSPSARLGKRALDRLAQVRPTLGPAILAVARRPF